MIRVGSGSSPAFQRLSWATFPAGSAFRLAETPDQTTAHSLQEGAAPQQANAFCGAKMIRRCSSRVPLLEPGARPIVHPGIRHAGSRRVLRRRTAVQGPAPYLHARQKRPLPPHRFRDAHRGMCGRRRRGAVRRHALGSQDTGARVARAIGKF
eukprot:gene9180-biopygen15227